MKKFEIYLRKSARSRKVMRPTWYKVKNYKKGEIDYEKNL